MGRLRIEFYVRKTVAETPVMQPAGMHSTLSVSTPEATALDLVDYASRLGGIRRAADVIAGMKPVMSVAGLRAALKADTRRAVQQRLGYVLQTLEMPNLAAEVARRIELLNKAHPVGAAVALQVRVPVDKAARAVPPWNVFDNIALQGNL
jgi:hypothetical protein